MKNVFKITTVILAIGLVTAACSEHKNPTENADTTTTLESSGTDTASRMDTSASTDSTEYDSAGSDTTVNQ
jgi:hypothetical protein